MPTMVATMWLRWNMRSSSGRGERNWRAVNDYARTDPELPLISTVMVVMSSSRALASPSGRDSTTVAHHEALGAATLRQFTR